jgi:hypothetical protein
MELGFYLVTDGVVLRIDYILEDLVYLLSSRHDKRSITI